MDNLSKVKVDIHPGFPNMCFSTQKHCPGRFLKFTHFLDTANQSHLLDSRSNWADQSRNPRHTGSTGADQPCCGCMAGWGSTPAGSLSIDLHNPTQPVSTPSAQGCRSAAGKPRQKEDNHSKRHLYHINTAKIIEGNALLLCLDLISLCFPAYRI